MARLLHIDDARPRGAAHWLRVMAALAAAGAIGGGLAWWMSAPCPSAKPARVAMLEKPRTAADAASATSARTVVAATTPTARVTCPIQSLELALGGGAPQTICVDATLIRQAGSVRTYEVKAGGVEGWTLQVDVAGGALFKASLVARDGQRYTCDTAQCAGVSLGRHDTRGVRSLTLADLTLPRTVSAAGRGEDAVEVARVSGRLSVPSDDQLIGLACEGPSVLIGSRDGSSRKFCGQGGAGFEVADDGSRNYRFQDHEGQTLMVAVAPDQRVSAVQFGAYACRGTACSGASTSSTDPANDMAERSFFFGRTPLSEGGAPSAASARSAPALMLDGTLVMPKQE